LKNVNKREALAALLESEPGDDAAIQSKVSKRKRGVAGDEKEVAEEKEEIESKEDEKKGKLIDVVLEKDGPGRLYYRIGLTYAPSDPVLPALNRGFRVSRTFSYVDHPGDVKFNDGKLQLRLGGRVNVTLNVSCLAPRHHVAIVDPLAAGLEAVDPSLKKKGPASDSEWEWKWFTYRNFRRTRVEVFATEMWPHTYSVNYVATAIAVGVFVWPPLLTEEMYNPEVFGHSETTHVEIVE